MNRGIAETDPAEKVKKLSQLKAEQLSKKKIPDGNSAARAAYGSDAFCPARGKNIILATAFPLL